MEDKGAIIVNPRVAILWHGDRETRRQATADNNRFSAAFAEFEKYGITAEPAVYSDEFADDVRQQLTGVDGVLVWVNPVQDGTDRAVLDAMLREVASRGTFVSTHPDIIFKLGTKDVLFQTRDMDWGGDIHVYRTLAELREQLPIRLAQGKSRVLKQNRGNGGSGVGAWSWRREHVGTTRWCASFRHFATVLPKRFLSVISLINVQGILRGSDRWLTSRFTHPCPMAWFVAICPIIKW